MDNYTGDSSPQDDGGVVEPFLPKLDEDAKQPRHHGENTQSKGLRRAWTSFSSASASQQLGPSILWGHIGAICCTSLIWGLCISIYLQTTTHLQKPATTSRQTRELSCGGNTTEARALGCEFDALSESWIPSQCVDRETLDEYQKSVFWRGFNDENGTQLLDLEEMSERVRPSRYYTYGWEHVVHCLFMWQRQHKLFLKGGLYMDTLTASYGHTVHCTDVLLEFAESNRSHLDKLNTQTTIGITGCTVDF